jgi:hypothetical protein
MSSRKFFEKSRDRAGASCVGAGPGREGIERNKIAGQLEADPPMEPDEVLKLRSGFGLNELLGLILVLCIPHSQRDSQRLSWRDGWLLAQKQDVARCSRGTCQGCLWQDFPPQAGP